jgi:glycosyltransferase involved in cell wall biosynthesis
MREKPRRRILFAGRVVPGKGVHILIEAFNGLVEEFPDTELAIVGPSYKTPRAAFAIHTSKEAIVRALAKFGGTSFEQWRNNSVLGTSPVIVTRSAAAGVR